MLFQMTRAPCGFNHSRYNSRGGGPARHSSFGFLARVMPSSLKIWRSGLCKVCFYCQKMFYRRIVFNVELEILQHLGHWQNLRRGPFWTGHKMMRCTFLYFLREVPRSCPVPYEGQREATNLCFQTKVWIATSSFEQHSHETRALARSAGVNCMQTHSEARVRMNSVS